jgi:hypothetical protein
MLSPVDGEAAALVQSILMIVLATLGIAALVVFALWYSQRGESAPVVGDGNAFNAYYGKNRFTPGQSPPCKLCSRRGCIGAGACRCTCHRENKRT